MKLPELINLLNERSRLVIFRPDLPAGTRGEYPEWLSKYADVFDLTDHDWSWIVDQSGEWVYPENNSHSMDYRIEVVKHPCYKGD